MFYTRSILDFDLVLFFIFTERFQGFYQRLSRGWSTEGCWSSPKSYEGFWSVYGVYLTILNLSKVLSLNKIIFFEHIIYWFWITGTDENAIIELLGSRSNKQRVPMVAGYKTTYGKVCFFLFVFFTDEIHFAIHFFPLTLYGVSEAEFCFCSVFFLLGFGPRSEVWAHWKLWEAGSRYDNEACTLRCVSNERGYKGWKLELLSQQMLQLWFCSSNPHSVIHHVIGKLERKKHPISASKCQSSGDLSPFYFMKQVCLWMSY